MEVLVENVGGNSVHSHKFFGEAQFPVSGQILSQLQNAWLLTCWNLFCQEVQMMLVVEEISRQLQRVWEDKFWKNNWLKVAAKGREAESFQQKL